MCLSMPYDILNIEFDDVSRQASVLSTRRKEVPKRYLAISEKKGSPEPQLWYALK